METSYQLIHVNYSHFLLSMSEVCALPEIKRLGKTLLIKESFYPKYSSNNMVWGSLSGEYSNIESSKIEGILGNSIRFFLFKTSKNARKKIFYIWRVVNLDAYASVHESAFKISICSIRKKITRHQNSVLYLKFFSFFLYFCFKKFIFKRKLENDSKLEVTADFKFSCFALHAIFGLRLSSDFTYRA